MYVGFFCITGDIYQIYKTKKHKRNGYIKSVCLYVCERVQKIAEPVVR